MNGRRVFRSSDISNKRDRGIKVYKNGTNKKSTLFEGLSFTVSLFLLFFNTYVNKS